MQSHTNFIRFAWQAWHKLTSTVVLRGRRGTDGTGWRAWTGLGAPWSRVTPRHSAWQAWHLVTFTFVLRGRRGTNSHLPSFCVAGVGQMALGGALGLAWARLGRAWRRGILRGRRGTWWHSLSFCVAGVAQTHIYRRFAWQAWDRWHWVARLDWLGRALVARDAAAFCVAGVALGDIHFRSAWQAWHKLTSTVVLRGRRGTDGTGWRAWTGLGAPWSRVTPRHSAWQAWHLVTFTFVLRGRRGTNSHLPSFCVAGVGQMALGGALGLAWARLGRAWRRGILRGRRGTWWHSLSLCVAGVAQTHIYRRFAWQAWDRWHWVARLDWLGRALVARDAAAFCVAGVALGDIHFRSAWQAWRKLTSIPLFCVAGVAQTHIYRRFAWQAWDRWHWVACLVCQIHPAFSGLFSSQIANAVAGLCPQPGLPAWPQEGRQDCVRLCLFWHVCFLTCLIAFFLWLVSFPVTFAARWWSSFYLLRQAGPNCAWSNTFIMFLAQCAKNHARWHCKNVTRCLCSNGINIGLLATRKVGGYAACQCLHWPPFMSCTVLC